MNKPEFYPYVLLPEEIEKIKIEGIPVPETIELPAFPKKPKKKFLGTVILFLSVAVIFIFSFKILKIDYTYENAIIAFAFFVAIVSLTATVFEILHNGKTKKRYKIAIKLHNELQKEQEEIKGKRSQAIEDNNSASAIEAYRHDAINKYFRYSYNKIQAVQQEHTVAQNRFVVFLEQYFEGKLLENIRIVHEPKELDYSPDFVIKLDSPKVNIAIDIEEPYLFDGTKIVVKKNRAEEFFKIRYRVTNELRWVTIVLNEEQIVTHPTESCKLIAHTIDEILLKKKYSESFKNVEKLKRVEIPGQRELSAYIRNKHREKYLAAAGLIDGLEFDPSQFEFPKIEKNLSEKEEKTLLKKNDKEKEHPIDKSKEEKISEKKQIVDFKNDKILEKKVEKETVIEQKDVKKQEHEVEQLQIVKRVTDKLRSEKFEKEMKDSTDKERPKKEEEEKEKLEKTDNTLLKKDTETDKKVIPVAKGQLKREADILNKLYSIKDTKKEKIILDTEKVEPLKKEQLEKSQIEKEHLEKENVEKERLEKERLAKEKLEKEAQEKSQLEKEHLEKEKEEKVRLEKERLAKNRLEKERIEKERLEKENVEKESLEKERLTKEKQVKEQGKKERKEKEKAEKDRLEKESLEKEKIEKIRLEKEKIDIDKLQNELDKKAEIKANNELMAQYKNQIEVLVSNQEWDKLFDRCHEVINKFPYWDWPYYRISTVHGNQGKFDEVLEDCNKTLALNPKLPDAYYNRATANFFLEKYQGAVDDYQKSIDLKYKNSVDAYFNKGLCYQNMDYHKKAYREFLKAKDLGSKKAIEIINQQYAKE